MNTKHTQGPWKATIPSLGAGIPILAGGELLASVFNRPTAKSEANARLIESAPDLLDAAQHAISALSCVSNGKLSPQPYCDCYMCEASKILGLAIAKATGKALVPA